MTIRFIPDMGVMWDGHDVRPDAFRDEVRTWLRAQGVDPWDLDELDIRAARAWWGGEHVGFVQEHHADAEPVTATDLPRLVLAKVWAGPF